MAAFIALTAVKMLHLKLIVFIFLGFLLRSLMISKLESPEEDD